MADTATQAMEVTFKGKEKPLTDSLGRVEKAQKRTTDSAKKTGDEGQKAMNRWGKSMDKAGGSAYDFGNQILSSTTVMEAMKEGSTGAVEWGLKMIYDALIVGGSKQLRDWAAGLDVEIEGAVKTGDWGKVADYLAETMFGKETYFGDYSMATKVMDVFQANIKAAIAAEDWVTVNVLIGKKMALGGTDAFTGVDAAIIAAIGKGDYSGAVAVIDANMAAKGNFDQLTANLTDSLVIGIVAASDAMYDLAPDVNAAFAKVTDAFHSGMGDAFADSLHTGYGAQVEKDSIAAWVRDGIITGAEGAQMLQYIGLDELHDHLVREMQDAGAAFGTALKDPKNLAGIGDAVYNAVLSDLAARNRG